MCVQDNGSRVKKNSVSHQPCPPHQVNILIISKILIIEKSDLIKDILSHKNSGCRRAEHLFLDQFNRTIRNAKKAIACICTTCNIGTTGIYKTPTVMTVL